MVNTRDNRRNQEQAKGTGPAQKGKGAGALRSQTDGYSSPTCPAESVALKFAYDVYQERNTPSHALQGGRYLKQVSTACRRMGGIVSEANAWGNAQDMPTETRLAGRYKLKEE